MNRASDTPDKAPPRHAWYAVGLLTLANVSSFLDRQILALLVVPIKRDLRLSDTKMSLPVGLSFALFYTVFGIVISRLADRANRRNIITAGIALWSALTALCAGVKNFGPFFLARMGVGEATLSPSAYSLIADYFPKRKLGVAMSVFTMGIFLGSGPWPWRCFFFSSTSSAWVGAPCRWPSLPIPCSATKRPDGIRWRPCPPAAVRWLFFFTLLPSGASTTVDEWN